MVEKTKTQVHFLKNISPEAHLNAKQIQATLQALDTFTQTIARANIDPEQVFVYATASLRIPQDADAFIESVQKNTHGLFKY